MCPKIFLNLAYIFFGFTPRQEFSLACFKQQRNPCSTALSLVLELCCVRELCVESIIVNSPVNCCRCVSSGSQLVIKQLVLWATFLWYLAMNCVTMNAPCLSAMDCLWCSKGQFDAPRLRTEPLLHRLQLPTTMANAICYERWGLIYEGSHNDLMTKMILWKS